MVAGVFGGMAMAQNQYSSFGHGAQGFGKYYFGAFADQAIGNLTTEALLPPGPPGENIENNRCSGLKVKSFAGTEYPN